MAAALWAAACGGGQPTLPSDLIDRETFIATYVDLRIAALQSPDRNIDTVASAEVLRRRGLEAHQLLDFADVHGRDVEFMRAVWDEVERRISEYDLSEGR